MAVCPQAKVCNLYVITMLLLLFVRYLRLVLKFKNNVVTRQKNV